MRIHIFNPEHDHALAANQPNYTAPHAARQLRSELSYLPALWAEDGDLVVVDDTDVASHSYSNLKLNHHTLVSFVTLNNVRSFLPSLDDVDILPWGWDITIRSTMLKAGVPETSLPTMEDINKIRDISNRSTAVTLLGMLKEQHDMVTGFSHVCTTYDDFLAFLDRHRDIVVKAPWSCSGRGVRYIKSDTVNINIIRWVQGVLRQQQSVVAEVRCPKVMDFAVEFLAEQDGRVRAVGLSLFNTVNGAYTGNILASEEEKRAMIAAYLPLHVLDSMTCLIERFMESRLDGAYHGPFGVDMMIVEGDGTDACPRFLLNPCVEINLRRTMGHVALALSERGHTGVMDIAFENKFYKVKLSNNDL